MELLGHIRGKDPHVDILYIVPEAMVGSACTACKAWRASRRSGGGENPRDGREMRIEEVSRRAKDVSTRACAWDLQPGPDAAQFRTISIVFETEDSRVIRLNLISGCVTFSPALTLRLFESAVGAVGNLASRLEAPRRKR